MISLSPLILFKIYNPYFQEHKRFSGLLITFLLKSNYKYLLNITTNNTIYVINTFRSFNLKSNSVLFLENGRKKVDRNVVI